MNPIDVKRSQFLSYVLRHKPEKIGLVLDDQGWADLATLLAQAVVHGEYLTEDDVRRVVATNDKQRFQLSEDGARIRAVQGHSTAQVEITRPAKRPPAVLYHGTQTSLAPSILKQGLIPGRRHQVHLSADVATAQAVGGRRGPAIVVFEVDAGALHARGHRFEQAENGVWLTATVPAWALRRR